MEDDNKVEEITDEEAARLEAEANGTAPPPETAKEEKKEDGEDSDDDPNLIKPILNGARHDTYYWTQTLSELNVGVYLPDGVRAKNLDVIFTPSKLKVGVKGQTPVLNGELFEKIKPDDSLWTIEEIEGRRVCLLSIEKHDQMRWWDCVVKGEPKINTKKIDPENSKLSDLDGETRSTVEKMMFDQQAKMAGKPTSDEIEKKDKLKAFMDAHPQLDFSKAKFT